MRDDPNAQRLAAIQRIEAWLDLPEPEALEACARAVESEDQARTTDGLLFLVIAAQARDLGIQPGNSRLQELDAGYRAGTLDPAVLRLLQRHIAAFKMVRAQRERFPAIAAAAPDGEAAARARLAALQARQWQAVPDSLPDRATSARLQPLQAVLDDYRALTAAVPPGSAVHQEACMSAAHTAWALASGWCIAGRMARAAGCFAEAAEFFAQCGMAADAAAARDRTRSLGFARQGDVDGASEQDLRLLAAGGAASMSRARAYARLAGLARAANDPFGAAEWAERAAEDFSACGFADPQGQPIDAVLDGWIATACDVAPGPAALRLMLEVATTYLAILGTRQVRWLGGAQWQAAEAAFNVLKHAARQIAAQLGEAQDAVQAALARYVPEIPAHATAADDGTEERRAAVEARIATLAAQADAAADLPALQAQAAACVADAQAFRTGATAALALRMLACVRLAAGDAPGAADAAVAGEAAMLDGAPATPATMAAHPLFDVLLMLRRVRLRALGTRGDWPGVADVAAGTIELIEARRAGIGDPFQQGGFLAGRTFPYEHLALAALKLGQHDRLLNAMELIKARAALAGRLAPAGAADPALDAAIAAVTADLAKAPAGSAARDAALERRRLLLALRAIGRGRGAAPALSVAAVQAGLATDEAVVTWVWIAPRVLIVLALRPGGVHADRAVLADAEGALLDAFVADLQAGRLDGGMSGAAISQVAAAVLPGDTRRFIAGVRRLILSPHRALHLLPFHAAELDGGLLIERAAIRYVPNLGSLLFPWTGAPEDGGLLAVGIDQFTANRPYWDAGWGDLTTAEAEARAVAAPWAARGVRTDVIIGPDASVAAFRALTPLLGTYRCIHLATHGTSVFDEEAALDPFASRLILQDGALDALAIGQLRLGAAVVVLSACHSGQRALRGPGLADLPGDDVFGLQAALFEAGTWGVIGALWPVDDRVAPLIMPMLHAGLADGMPAEVALQQAVLAYLRRPDARRAVYYWGALFLSAMGQRPSV
jgi:hypothetical protein